MQERHVVTDATLEAKEGCASRLADLMRATQAACAKEAGCLTYRFMRDLDDPNRFYILEIWESEAALEAHKVAEPFKAFIAGLPELGRLVSVARHIGPLEPYGGQPSAEPQA